MGGRRGTLRWSFRRPRLERRRADLKVEVVAPSDVSKERSVDMGGGGEALNLLD